MKKIGVITHYYQSSNYGANLQANALVHFLNSEGYNAEQICYQFSLASDAEPAFKRIIKKIMKNPIKGFILIFKKIGHKFAELINFRKIKEKKIITQNKINAFKDFNQNFIPHSEKVFSDSDIKEADDFYDVFITGSDQVFNLSWFKEPFFLTFTSKKKISYAASMALDFIPREKEKFLKESLSSFKSISVREDKTVLLLKDLKIDAELSVDPCFLLDELEWEKVSSNIRVGDNYIVCYFLGKNKESRNIAKLYAKRNGLKIVCIPLAVDDYCFLDMQFGDYNFPYATPQDFLSLIKNADFVFTDSFHACVFSIIFNKKFVVFNRDGNETMSSRIHSLLKLFHCPNRFVKTNTSIDQVNALLNENNDYHSEEFISLREKSICYLRRNLDLDE